MKTKQLEKYISFIVVGGIVYFVMKKYAFAGDGIKKNKLTEYYEKMYGDREKLIQQESPEKFMYNTR